MNLIQTVKLFLQLKIQLNILYSLLQRLSNPQDKKKNCIFSAVSHLKQPKRQLVLKIVPNYYFLVSILSSPAVVSPPTATHSVPIARLEPYSMARLEPYWPKLNKHETRQKVGLAYDRRDSTLTVDTGSTLTLTLQFQSDCTHFHLLFTSSMSVHTSS